MEEALRRLGVSRMSFKKAVQILLDRQLLLPFPPEDTVDRSESKEHGAKAEAEATKEDEPS
jgi:hypothetical protein